MLQTEVVEKIKTRFSCSKAFFENRAVYEITWKNIVQPYKPQMTIWRLRIAYWVPTATKAHSEYVIFIAVPLQQLLHGLCSMLRYTYIPYLV